ncbi:transposase [Streptomyces sp. 3N207]|uniref:transposase n=1 Tax=Streptomyces sp. 3N207 TaxID=3457417 RepID=UPI003FD01D30
MAEVACCFPRRDWRLPARQMTQAMLMELERRNCWTLAEAPGRPGPHRLQHFLSRGSWDHEAARDRLARWAASELAEERAVLAIDETGDEKSSTDCVGAARQYSGALGGAVPGRCPPHLRIGARPRADRPGVVPARRLGRAEDEERRLLTHVPDEIIFATKP